MARKLHPLAVAWLVVAGAIAGALPGALASGGAPPVPTCKGIAATHVLVPDDGFDYQAAWPGVDVQVNRIDNDNVLFGTAGPDVLVSIAEPNQRGDVMVFFAGPPKNSGNGVSEGDLICGTRFHDQFYAGPGSRGITVYGGDGGDDFYIAGDGHRIFAGAGVDSVWIMKVPKGSRTVVRGGPDQDHVYQGRVLGELVYYGGGAPKDVHGGGDHLHPCPVERGSNPGPRTTLVGVEYVGPESAFMADPFDPCAWGARSLD